MSVKIWGFGLKPKKKNLKELIFRKKTARLKKMEFIYQKESNLDKENNFTIEISEKNNVEKVKFIGGN